MRATSPHASCGLPYKRRSGAAPAARPHAPGILEGEAAGDGVAARRALHGRQRTACGSHASRVCVRCNRVVLAVHQRLVEILGRRRLQVDQLAAPGGLRRGARRLRRQREQNGRAGDCCAAPLAPPARASISARRGCVGHAHAGVSTRARMRGVDAMCGPAAAGTHRACQPARRACPSRVRGPGMARAIAWAYRPLARSIRTHWVQYKGERSGTPSEVVEVATWSTVSATEVAHLKRVHCSATRKGPLSGIT